MLADVTAQVQDRLYDSFLATRRERKLRHRDAAQALGVSEGEAIASAVGRKGALGAVRLTGPWPDLFEQVPTLGPVMALTRNETTVHEKTGSYADMSHDGPIGLALGPDIDLRIFYMRWAQALAVSEQTAQGVQRSLQIYDGHGDAVHKVFLREGSNLEAWMDFVEANTADEQAPGMAVDGERDAAGETSDESVDVAAFHQAWATMTDTHEFFPLLRRFKLARTQALRLAPGEFARRVATSSARQALQEAARDRLSIMCFVGNPGMIQIHTGPVSRVEMLGDWLNVLDPGFNLHLREDRIDTAWVVRKPTADGVVTSLELFDAAGTTMAMFFGERKPGKPELAAWRELTARLPNLGG